MKTTTGTDLTDCELPDGTVLAVAAEHAHLVFAWVTPGGSHIVHSRIPTSHLIPANRPALAEATRTFRLAIALEVMADCLRSHAEAE